MSSLIGQSLGRYQVLEQLGEGGMATVYKAYDTRLERNVAIKVIRTDQVAPALLDEMMKRFEREAKALAKLSHPNIVHVHDYGEYEGAPYLVMEYLPSGTLQSRPDKPMPWQEAVHTLLPIAQALAYAHAHNIIHRDIKPGNILLTENGLPMLSDFGIAKILENNQAGPLTSTGKGIGTPEYMAPEQWTGQSVPQSDIYSLGVVLYELVTGRKPYSADTPAGIMLKQASEPLPRPRQFVADLPEGLENVLLKALARQPEERYQSMGEFAAALENLTSGQTLLAGEKLESGQANKTVLAPVGDRLEAGLAAASAGGGSQTGGPNRDGPVPPKEHRRTKPIGPRRWIPIAVLGVLLLSGLAAGTGLVIQGLQGKRAQAGLTNPQSSPAIVQTPPGRKIKVLWDTSHGPRTSGNGSLYTPDGMYTSLAQVLGKDGFVISSGDLTNLDSYDILVLSETSAQTPYSTAEVDKIEQFVRVSGHGLLILSDSPDLENLADIVARRFSISLGELTSDGPTSNSSEPFFSGVSSIQFIAGGGILQVSPPSQTASVDKNGNPVIAFCECDAGRVMTIADANLWDNNGLNQADNQRFSTNVFKWLAKSSP